MSKGSMYNYYLRGLIVRSGMNQKSFAEAIGMGPVHLSRLIHGDVKQSRYKQLIADYFNKPVNVVFKGGDNGRTREKQRRY